MILIVFIFTFLVEGSFSKSDNGSVYKDLRTKILTGYDTNIRPVKDYDKPVNVSVLISLERLINVDTRTSTITFEAYMVLNWADEFLVWNPNDYQGIDHINLPPSLIWKPDVIVSVSWTRYYEQDNLDLQVKSNGQVLWIRVLIVSLRCAMDLSDYPFDKQQCFFLVLTKFDTTNTVQLYPYSDDKLPVINLAQSYNPEWTVNFDRNILSNTTNRNDTKQYIFVSMTMKRKSSAYHYILVMPYFACNMLIFYAFMLPQSSRRRLFLGALALFIDLMLLLLVGYELGFDSNHNTPYAVKCLSINIIMVSLFIIISIFGSRYIAKSTSQAPLWVQGLVKNGFVGKFLLIQVSSKELADIDSEMAKLNNQSQSSTEPTEVDQRSSDWILLTAILDRLFLIIYTISFIIYHS